jgi:hypothetical protein
VQKNVLSTFVQKYEEVQSAGQIILKIIPGWKKIQS